MFRGKHLIDQAEDPLQALYLFSEKLPNALAANRKHLAVDEAAMKAIVKASGALKPGCKFLPRPAPFSAPTMFCEKHLINQGGDPRRILYLFTEELLNARGANRKQLALDKAAMKAIKATVALKSGCSCSPRLRLPSARH